LETDLGNFDNSWYWKNYNQSTFIKRGLWFVIGNLSLNNYLPIPVVFKVFILRLFGAKVGENVMIKPKVNIKYPWFLEIGHNCWIGEQVWVDNLAKVKIENNVCISQGALLLTGNHDYSKTTFDMKIGEIVLENGVWIGAKAIVGPGVTCHSHSILSLGSVTSTDLESFSIYRGNPAVFVRQRKVTIQ
jgi:putative colanic acid biosynthesis acetyltransferase WcaF